VPVTLARPPNAGMHPAGSLFMKATRDVCLDLSAPANAAVPEPFGRLYGPSLVDSRTVGAPRTTGASGCTRSDQALTTAADRIDYTNWHAA
jgi:hypothetical protein